MRISFELEVLGRLLSQFSLTGKHIIHSFMAYSNLIMSEYQIYPPLPILSNFSFIFLVLISVHASDKKDSQEIKDLYEMLKTDLTPTEKSQIRRSLERQRLGQNRDLLSSVKVVGVTCAACTFPCMSKLIFPVSDWY